MEFIDDCLGSIRIGSEGIASEIIVVDNGSTDGTTELIRNKYPEVALISNTDNLGFARAVNQGLKTARGEYLLLLNQDTRIVGNAIIKLMERLIKDERIGVIGPKFIGFDGTLQKSGRAFPRYRDLLYEFTGLSYLFPRSTIFGRWKMGWFDHLTEREIDQPMGAALMFRKKLIDEMGPFDERLRIFFNDVDFCRRAKDRGYKNLYYPDAVIAHFLGGSTRKAKPQMILESHRAMFLYFKKYNRNAAARPLLYFWGLILFMAAVIRAGFVSIFHR
jgi:GT2 family glycosyltransferase